MITTVCKISYGSQTVPPIVPAVQGDTGRAISFEIADFTPPAGATATYFILKPSGEAIYNSATITDNSILCELTAQSLAEAGENRMQVRVLQGENIVTSFEVILMVRTFLGDDAIESGTEMNIFDQAVEQAAEEFQTQAEQIVEEVIESIPSDYTALTEEVDELNERLSDAKSGLKLDQVLQYEFTDIIQGTYSVNSTRPDKWADSSTRIRTAGLIPVYYGMKIHFVPGSNAQKMLYGGLRETDPGAIYDSQWISTETIIDIGWNGHIICVFGRSDNENITPADYDATFELISKSQTQFDNMANAFDSAVSDRSSIKNAIFRNGWYDIKAEGNAISGMADSSTIVCAVLPVEFGDYVYVNAYASGSESGGARTYAFTDENGIILKRAVVNENVSRYIIAPTGSKYFYVQNSLLKLSTGFYAYVGYDGSQQKRNIKKLENGVNIFTNYSPGYYDSSDTNDNFPYPNYTRRKMESMLLSVTPGETYYAKGSTNDPASTEPSWAEAIVFDSSGNVLTAWTSKVNEYSRAVYIPENGAYLGVNTYYEYEKAYVSKYDDINCLLYTNMLTQWESGGIGDIAGDNTPNNKRIRIKSNIAVYRNKKIEIVLPNGYVGLAYKYDELGDYIGYQTPWSNKIKSADIPVNTHYIRVIVKSVNTPDADISGNVSYIAENTIIREETKTEEIEIKDVQEITTAINFYPDDITTGKTIDANGDEVNNASYKVTDFVKIPKKYNKLLLYTHAFSESGNAPIVAFYDESMVFIEMATTDTDCITNEDTYVYAKAVFPVADTECDLSFTNETIKPDYAPPKKYLLFTNDLNSYGRNVISDGAVEAIINTGLKYLGDERFGYGTEHTAFAEECIKTTKDTHTPSSSYEGERYQMDCSTYVLLMMMGITPECSRYFYSKNIPSNWGYRFNRLVEYEGYVYGVAQTGDTKRLYANSIAEYAYKNGYLFLVNDNLSNIRPGDIFFLSNQGESYNFFENIGHCGMVIDSIQMENGGRTIVTFEGNGGSTSPCRYHTYTARQSTMIYAARFPMPFVHNDAINIAEFSETVTTAVSGTSGDTVDIATVNISKQLENGKVYTVCVKCDLPDNCYLMLKSNGMSHLGVANENIIKRPDGYRTFHIFAKKTDTISTTGSITLQAKCTGNVNGSAVLSMVRVYDGFVSPEFT